jgi:flagellar motility protein MotE (MotC chaperone)
MKNGYNDFFQAAKSVKKNPTQTPPIKSKISTKPTSVKPIQKKMRKNGGSTSYKSLLTLGVGFVLTGWGYLYLDELLSVIDRVQVSPMSFSEASADSGEKKSTDQGGEKEKNAANSKNEKPITDEAKSQSVLENVSHFTKLNERKVELDRREQELNELESELHEQRKEVEARIRKLEEIRSQIGQVLKERVEIDEEKVKKLVEFYSDMKPQNAAKIIATLNEDLAVEILGKMKKKNAADILNLLNPDKAQVLTEKFAGYKRR